MKNPHTALVVDGRKKHMVPIQTVEMLLWPKSKGQESTRGNWCSLHCKSEPFHAIMYTFHQCLNISSLEMLIGLKANGKTAHLVRVIDAICRTG